jgi:tRNA pseudouridine55 synthase
VLLDKPLGLSSNQALQRTKRLFQAAKAGHTGSLDPLATGMLPICFGAATKLCGYLLDSRKTYSVAAQLGVATSTGDAEGEVIGENSGAAPEEAQVLAALAAFLGEHEQVPPMYSALKKDGIPLYRLARRGIEVARAPRRIVIYAIALHAYAYPEVRFTVCCSKGTYVRTLVTDLAAALNTLGHVTGLRRLSVDPYAEHQLKTWEQLEDCLRNGGLEALDRELLPADGAIESWPRIDLAPEAAARLLHGQKLAADAGWPRGQVRVYGGPSEFLAIGDVTEEGELVPRKVFLP